MSARRRLNRRLLRQLGHRPKDGSRRRSGARGGRRCRDVSWSAGALLHWRPLLHGRPGCAGRRSRWPDRAGRCWRRCGRARTGSRGWCRCSRPWSRSWRRASGCRGSSCGGRNWARRKRRRGRLYRRNWWRCSGGRARWRGRRCDGSRDMRDRRGYRWRRNGSGSSRFRRRGRWRCRPGLRGGDFGGLFGFGSRFFVGEILEVLPGEFGVSDVDRTRVGLLLGNADFRQIVDEDFCLDFQLASELIDSNLIGVRHV